MSIENATIKSTHLGDGRGSLTYLIHVTDREGVTRAAGGLALTRFPGLGLHLQTVLSVVGVDRWEDLPGKHIRIKRGDGYASPIQVIGHIVKDRWVSIEPPGTRVMGEHAEYGADE